MASVDSQLSEQHNDRVDSQEDNNVDGLNSEMSSACSLTNSGKSISQKDVEELKNLINNLFDQSNCEQNKRILEKFIETNFIQREWKILFVGMLSCPWHHLSNSDDAIATGKNKVLCIYAGKNIDLYSLECQNEEKENGLILLDNFMVLEVRHFIQRLLKGLLDVTELLFIDDSMVIKSSDEWRKLISSMENSIKDDLGLRSVLPFHFLKRCQAQSINITMKKTMNGQQYEFTEPVDAVKLFDSLRLLTHLECLRTRSLILSSNDLKKFITTCHFANYCFEIIKKFQQNLDNLTLKKSLLEAILDWHKSLETSCEQLEQHSYTWLQDWLTWLRLGENCSLKPSLSITSADGELVVKEILETLSANCNSPALKTLMSDQILLATQFGSSLYNVSVKSSDTDYMLVFCESANKYVTKDFVPIKSIIECRGPTMDIEFTAYEVSKVAESLLKGSVNWLELVFINPDHLQWASQAWRYLHEHAASQFLSELAITQFMGYAKNHLKRLEKGSRRQVKNPGKVLYHIRHKLNSVRSMLAGQIPEIRLYDDKRQSVMEAREITDIELAIRLGYEELDSVQNLLHSRTNVFRKNVDHRFLQRWIGFVRGFS